MLAAIAVEGTWLDREDVSRLLRLSLPGIDELAALLEISRLADSGHYDLIVVDTAPTGHTLRMLAMPQTLFGIAVAFDHMREKHRVMQEALLGQWRQGSEDALVSDLAETARGLAAVLRDPARTELSWTTLPEPMAIAETADALEALAGSGIGVTTVIVNRLTPAPPSRCHHCEARQAFEAAALKWLPRGPAIRHVRALDGEPRGARALRTISADLERSVVPAAAAGRRRRPWMAHLEGSAVQPPDLLEPSLNLVLVGGKGGVGKTTIAAASAVAAATRWPDRQVLLISTDPAHSLADVFGLNVSDHGRRIPDAPANLKVRELDASVVFSRLRDRYLGAIDQVFDRLGGGGAFDAVHDRAVMHGLIDLAPPGLDELASVLEITDALTGAAPEWDLVVMDMAPTGHALRLLEMPRLVQDWVRALMTILLKYQGVARVGELGALLLNLSKGLGRLRELLVDRRRTMFMVVTRPAVLPRVETERLLKRLARLRVPVAAVVINAVGRGDCARCIKAARAQRREIGAIQAAARSVPALVVTAGRVPAPHGAVELLDWANAAWRRPPR